VQSKKDSGPVTSNANQQNERPAPGRCYLPSLSRTGAVQSGVSEELSKRQEWETLWLSWKVLALSVRQGPSQRRR